jgi:cell division protein FtsB
MRWVNRILVALLIAGAVALLPNYDGGSSEDRARVQAERDGLLAANAEIQDELALLAVEVDNLRGHARLEDPRARERARQEVARIAREDLNLVLPGEVVFEVERREVAK